MGYSGILRRLFSHSGNLRSRRNNSFRFYCRNSDGGGGGVSSPSVPWLMLPPEVDGSGNIAYKFQRLGLATEKEKEKKEVLQYSNRMQLPIDIDISKDVEFVGSSQGWLALFNWHNANLFLSNPITDQHLKLPPLHGLGAPDRVILERNLAFMTYGNPAKVAFCSPRRSKEWSLFRDGGAYTNIAYSSRHKRLLCLCRRFYERYMRLECWDVHHHRRPPTLEWEIQGIKELDAAFRWPDLMGYYQMIYLVCAEHSGDLFVVVRHIKRRMGVFPYKTVDFDVYRVDPERGEVMHMDRSLQGLAMFVGINQPIAIPAEGRGVMLNSVYFADDHHLVDRSPTTGYGGLDYGIFDYGNKDLYPIEYDNNLPLPLWFAPTPTTII